MPNRTAKDNKRKRALLNKKWSTEGRTAKQHIQKNVTNEYFAIFKNVF